MQVFQVFLGYISDVMLVWRKGNI